MMKQLFVWALVILSLFCIESCKPDEMGDIDVFPAHIVSGSDGVTLQVRGRDIPSGALIRIDQQVQNTQVLGQDHLGCTLQRESTLPQNPLASKWTLTVDLVGPSGAVVSKGSELSVQRDYQWDNVEKIAERGTGGRISVHRYGSDHIFLLYASEADILRLESDDSGNSWHEAEILFTLNGEQQAFELTVSEEKILIFLKEGNGLCWSDLTDGPSGDLPRLLPHTGQCDTFRVIRDSAGNLHVLWDEHPDEDRNWIRYSMSQNGGTTWTEPTHVVNELVEWTGYAGISGLAAHPEGIVYAAFRMNQGRYPAEYGRISRNGGQTWADTSPLDFHGSLFFGNGRVLQFGRSMYLPYLYNAFISLSENWGQSWQRVLYRDDDTYQNVDWMVADSRGNLLASLCQSDWQVKNLIRSLDRGLTWLVPESPGSNLPGRDDLSLASFGENGDILLFSSQGSGDGIWLRRSRSSY